MTRRPLSEGGEQSVRLMSAVVRGRDALSSVVRTVLAVAGLWIVLAAASLPAQALEPIVVQPDVGRLELTTLGDAYRGQGETLQVETAPGADGVTGRMAVRASTPGISPDWMVFALTNRTDRPVERWLSADRYSIVGSGIIWPDLDAQRIAAITPSIGFVPERIKSDKADIFRITLEPGQTITYAVEMASERFSRLYLWQPIEYEIQTRERQLFNGGMLGLVALLAVFLTAIFAANHKVIFPAAALVSWCVLTYLCVDFGLFHRLFNLRPEDNAVHRAAAEASMAASFVIFLYFFLRLSHWHGIVRMLIGVWMIAQLTLIAVAVVDPRLAATFARVSFAGIGAVGGLFTLFLALRRQERALALIPAWILFLVWIFAAALTVTAHMGGDVVVTSLIAGLVVVVIALGFTVTQFAFRSLEPAFAGTSTDLQSRSLALAGSGASIWEWNIRRDEIRVGPELEIALGMMPGELNGKVDDFVRHVHPGDTDKYRIMLASAQERAGVRIRSDFRMQHVDTTWRWLELEAASIPNADGRTLRCVGLIRDVSDHKRSHERLLHDAVHCSLTGLPNRALFIDRLKSAVARAATDNAIRPAVLIIDIDKFKSANASLGLLRGDSLLLNIARRLQRQVGEQDTVARLGGDQFAILFVDERDTRALPAVAERMRRSLRAPIPLGDKEIILTGSIGAALYERSRQSAEELLTDAELAMYRAKRGGADRIEIFEPSMRAERDDRIEIESDLRKALEKGQLKVLYQPIVYLPTKELAGFEALVRWEHPKLGLLNPVSFVPIAEESDLIVKVGSHVLMRAAADAARWQTELPRAERPLFVSVNVSTKQLFRTDSVQEMRHILGRNIVPPGSLRLEITETLVMENPEQAVEVLNVLRSAGANLALDDFGTGYSALAYLQKFPFDTIKIDRAIVGACTTQQGEAILRSIIALAHELSKSVVAEGVENSEEANLLRTLGCEYGQGYHFGEPITDRAVINLLRAVRKSQKNMIKPGSFLLSKARKADVKNRPRRKKEQADAVTARAANGSANGSANGTVNAAPSVPATSPAGSAPVPLPSVPGTTSPEGGAPSSAPERRSSSASLVDKLNALRTRTLPSMPGLGSRSGGGAGASSAPPPPSRQEPSAPVPPQAAGAADATTRGGPPMPPLVIPLASEAPLVPPQQTGRPSSQPTPQPPSPMVRGNGAPPPPTMPPQAPPHAQPPAPSQGMMPPIPADMPSAHSTVMQPTPANGAQAGQGDPGHVSRAQMLADRIARTLGGPPLPPRDAPRASHAGRGDGAPPAVPPPVPTPPPAFSAGLSALRSTPSAPSAVNTGAPPQQAQPPPQQAAGAPPFVPPAARRSGPPVPPTGATQGKSPDLSTLPPRIAQSLARLAGASSQPGGGAVGAADAPAGATAAPGSEPERTTQATTAAQQRVASGGKPDA